MKLLYAIQATGNGHISRAKELIPLLQKHVEVDVLLSGTSADIELGLPVRYRFKGLSFVFGKNGGIDVWKTILSMNFWQFLKDIKRLPLDEYEFIINDFEPVSAWACVFTNTHCIALSHQYSLLLNNVPKPRKRAKFSNFILKYYAPSTLGYGFHFKSYNSSVFLPIIKSEIKSVSPIKKNYFVVYLPAYDDQKIIKALSKFNKTNWVVFSKHCKEKYSHGNISVKPISTKKFNKKLINCRGVLCGAGFETPAEALYLNKKLLVIPMKNQYEQQCNAEALKKLGIPVINGLEKKDLEVIKSWIKSKKIIKVNYSETPQKVINQIFIDYIRNESRKMINSKLQIGSSDV